MKLYGFGPTRSLRALWGLKSSIQISNSLPVQSHRRRNIGAPTSFASILHGKVPVLVDRRPSC